MNYETFLSRVVIDCSTFNTVSKCHQITNKIILCVLLICC